MENSWNRDLIKRILVINGSPNREKSNTLLVTKAFLKGLNHDDSLSIKIINASDLKVTPCLGCLSCWGKTPGECVIKNDDIPKLKDEILNSDIIIASYPLYFFSMPGIMKVITDRLLSMMATYNGQNAPKDGESFHGFRYYKENRRFIIISTCAYTEVEGVYSSLISQHDAICGKNNYTPIFVPQMKTLHDLHNENKLNRYLEKFTIAGKVFMEKGKLSEEEILNLSKPPFTTGAYKVFLSNFWNEEKEKGRKS